MFYCLLLAQVSYIFYFRGQRTFGTVTFRTRYVIPDFTFDLSLESIACSKLNYIFYFRGQRISIIVSFQENSLNEHPFPNLINKLNTIPWLVLICDPIQIHNTKNSDSSFLCWCIFIEMFHPSNKAYLESMEQVKCKAINVCAPKDNEANL